MKILKVVPPVIYGLKGRHVNGHSLRSRSLLSTDMPPTVKPLKEDQVAECVYIYRAAFGSNVENKCVYPQGSTPELIDFFKKKYVDASRNDPKSHYIGAFDDASGELIAYAIWDLVDEEARQRDKDKAVKGEQDPQPPGINVAARKDFFEKMENAQQRWMGTKDFWRKRCSQLGKTALLVLTGDFRTILFGNAPESCS